MRNGIFSDGFTGVFGNALSGIFDDEFPSGALPDPRSVLADLSETGPSGEGPAIDLPVDVFDFDMPDEALETAGSMTLSAAVETDFGPLYAPGGNGPGGGGPGGGGPGGGGGGGPKGGGSTTPTVEYTSGSTDGSGFNIELQFFGDWSSASAQALITYMKAAAEFLSDLIVVGLPNDDQMFNSFNEANKFTVDDLLIEVNLGNLKGGVAAQTEIFGVNDFSNNGVEDTFTGATITFNKRSIDGLDSLNILDDTVLHEMFHALGFGYWGVAENTLTETSGSQIIYTGESADGTIVENDGLAGSIGAHWSEEVYDKELMTSVLETSDTMNLAYFSVASLQDLAVVSENGLRGYQLDGNWQTMVDTVNEGGHVDLSDWFVA